MNTTRDLQMPSGFEVESATLHPSVHEPLYEVERAGMRGRLDTLKWRGLSKVQDVQRAIGDRRAAMKSSLVSAKGSVRDGAKSTVTKVQDSMRTSPMKWAGIAAGAGFGLGLIGRIAQARGRSRRGMPDLVIIESGC